ncbi:metal ABC transporter permease [Desulfovibrio sp.]|uniref:metal ABC transporter permease n=1 Tax=Desulfovibrio sp. TaxID=885 RepID=UPI0025C4E59B|nr:metal ABC transporter permease [Desulfovibrio sp.]
MGPLAEKPGFSLDTAMGVVFSVVMSLAMLRTEGLSLIRGSLLTVTRFDLQLVAVTALLLFGFDFLFFKEIEAIMGQSHAAVAAGIPVKDIYYACLVLMGLVVAFALKAIDGLLIYALIVTPAATALQNTYRLSRMFLLAALFGRRLQ